MENMNTGQLLGALLSIIWLLILFIGRHLKTCIRFESEDSLTARSLWDSTDGEPANDAAHELCRRWGECGAAAKEGAQQG